VHEALKALLASATKSLVVSMYGYDDDELDQAIRGKLGSDKIFVQLSLDKSQSAGAHEKADSGEMAEQRDRQQHRHRAKRARRDHAQ